MNSQDKEMIDRARQGDKEAFRHLVETHQDRLFALVFSMVSNREQAEDLVQEVFVKAFFALEAFEGQSSFYTWLYRIASNHCLDYLRKRKLNAVSLDRPLGESSEVTFEEILRAPKSELPESSVEGLSEATRLLDTLEPNERLILTLRELEGLSYEELAEMMNCPVNTIKSRLNRAREALKATYVEFYGNIPDDKIVLESREKP